jgi:hypothetical protein
MAAIIKSQRNSAPATDISGASRDDLVLGDVVSVTSVDAATTYSWVLSYAPEGSAAVFSGSSSAVSPGTFNVDLEGPYLIRLTVDAGLPTEDTQYVRLRALTEFASLKLVSAGERRDGSGIIPVDVDVEGWANEQNFNLVTLLAFAKRTALTGRILYVDANDGVSNYADYSSINDAINGAIALGATTVNPYAVLVRAGVYSEDVVFQPGVHVIGWPGDASRGNVVQIRAANAGGTGTHQAALPLAADLVVLSNLDLINTGASATAAVLRKTGSGKVVLNDCVITQAAVAATVGPALDVQGGLADVLSCELLVNDSNANDRHTFAQTGASTTVEIRDSLIQGPSGITLNPSLLTTVNTSLQRTIIRVTGTAGLVGVQTSALALTMEHCLVEALQGGVTAPFQVHPSAGVLVSNVGVDLRWSRLDGDVTFDITGIVGATTWRTGATAIEGTVSFPGGPVSTEAATVQATSLFYDNAATTLVSENVQGAIDEIAVIAAPVIPFMLVSNEATDATSGTLALGQIEFDPGEYAGATVFEFLATFSVSGGTLTGTVSLYNVTDAEIVTGTTLTTASTTPVRLGSGALTVGAAAGNLKSTAKVYEVRLSVTGTLPTDIVTLGSAYFKIS